MNSSVLESYMIRRYPAVACPPWRALVYPERARRRAPSLYLLSFHTDAHSAPVTPLFLTLSSKTGEGGARPTFHLSLLPSAVYLFFATLQNPSEPRFSSSKLPLLPRKVRSAPMASTSGRMPKRSSNTLTCVPPPCRRSERGIPQTNPSAFSPSPCPPLGPNRPFP